MFEYSLDGAVWRTVEIAWMPDYSDDGFLTWERKITSDAPEPMKVKGEKGDTGDIGPTGPKGDKGEPGIIVTEPGAAEFGIETLKFLHPAEFVPSGDNSYAIMFSGAARFESDVIVFPEHAFIRDENLSYNVLVLP